MSSEQLQKLAELRKQRANAPQPSSNIVQVRLWDARTHAVRLHSLQASKPAFASQPAA